MANIEYIQAIESQQVFFEKITRNKLNELLNRVTTGYLKNDINKILLGYHCEVKISDICTDIYINFFDNNNDEKIGHISLHLDKQPISINSNLLRKGRFHVVNNKTNKYFTLRVKNKNDLFELIVNSPLKMPKRLEFCVKITLDILNSYTESSSKYFLKYHLTSQGNKINKCLKKIAGLEKQHRYSKTRIKKYINKVEIPKAPLISP